MPIALRRFRTTLATAILRMARHRRRETRPAAALAAAALIYGLTCTAVAEPAAGRLLAAGEAAAEQGWFAAARDHWREAARLATDTGDAATVDHAAAKSTRLLALELEFERIERERVRETAAAWVASDWPVAWEASDIAADCGAEAAASIASAAGLAVWNTGRTVHGVRLADGRPSWPTDDGPDTRLFPRGIAGGLPAPPLPCTLVPGAAVCVGHRAYAVIDQDRDGQSLVCLDLSDAAEGRLDWSAAVADAEQGGVAFDGSPVADHELCAVVTRADDARNTLTLAVFDARDGSLRWTRSLGPAIAADGIDAARGCRQPCLVEDRIVVATHAAVHAFDRDGGVAWTMHLPASATGSVTASSCSSAASVHGGRLLLATRDGHGVLAIDPRRGGILWHWKIDDGSVEAVLGGCSGGLVIATRGHDDPVPTLRRLSLDDGRQTANRRDEGRRVAGRGTVASGLVFWPAHDPDADTVDLELLDGVTLERRREPIRCRSSSQRKPAAVHLTVADGSLLIADDRLTCRRAASKTVPAPFPPASPR